VNDLGTHDYAFIHRTGTTVAYYNAGYARALRMSAALASWLGEQRTATAWRGRLAPLAAAFAPAFWDGSAGAFRDATEGPTVHPQDGNAFAILAGLASREQGLSALGYLSRVLWRPYGAGIADNDVWDFLPDWGDNASQRVYPFISYFEVLARYAAGLDASALQLIRREWGYMLNNGPRSTMWETIGPFGGPPVDPSEPSYDHGWSSGAAPALSEFVLGVAPASPGFATSFVRPRVTGLAWARGNVPTPHGTIHVDWSLRGRTLTLKVTVPTPATATVPLAGRTTLDGKQRPAQRSRTTVKLAPGSHTLVVTGPLVASAPSLSP
jgi:hypothetical protein